MNQRPIVLVTGAGGFLGRRVVYKLTEMGFGNVRCLARSAQHMTDIESATDTPPTIVEGDLTRRSDAEKAARGANIIIHCAAKKGGPLASMYLNTVIGTRNLLDCVSAGKSLERFVHVSSFSVYGTAMLKQHATVNEKTPLESDVQKRDDAYTFIKLKQEQLVRAYEKEFGLPIVIVRPGVIYGPGGDEISRRVGIRLFGTLLNIGRKNLMPISYVDNCAEAIILAAIKPGLEGEIVNIHDNDLRTCDQFLEGYKKEVKKIRTLNVAYPLFWVFSWLVDAYAIYSKGQIPAVLSPYKTASTWKTGNFSNQKLVERVGWTQTVSTEEGLARHFRYCSEKLTGINQHS